VSRRQRATLLVGCAAVVIAFFILRNSGGGASEAAAAWAGVDDSVIGRFVAEAGRPAPRPLFAWLQGDLLLFAFLWAGLIAGFVLGYWGRALFGETAGRTPREGGS
jgi:cobalt/nickel transport protein